MKLFMTVRSTGQWEMKTEIWGTLGSGNAETGEYIEFDIVRADEKTTKRVQELGKNSDSAVRTE